MFSLYEARLKQMKWGIRRTKLDDYMEDTSMNTIKVDTIRIDYLRTELDKLNDTMKKIALILDRIEKKTPEPYIFNTPCFCAESPDTDGDKLKTCCQEAIDKYNSEEIIKCDNRIATLKAKLESDKIYNSIATHMAKLEVESNE